jgi:hypothetical protein
MWKSIYALLFTLFPALMFAQLIEAPLQSNPALSLYSHTSEEQASMPNCPNLNGNFNYTFKNDTVNIKIDTAGIGYAVNPEFTMLDCDGIAPLGIVSFSGDILSYEAGDFDGFQEKVCVEYCPDQGECATIEYTFVTQRESQTHILNKIQINEEETIEDICLDANLLPGELSCNIFYYCPNGSYNSDLSSNSWMTYNEATSCFKYTAGLGEGIDTVCAVLCDEFGVCDYYKVPFEVQSFNLELPFWDDFSNNNGPYTSSQKWLTKDGFVNNTMAENPPSVGMVTLDGLDYSGAPYLEAGIADHLTSRGLNLNGLNSQDVSLRFFYAPKGNGLYPNGPDSLRVDYKDIDGNWIPQWVRSGIETSTDINESPEFQFATLNVPEEFRYDGFQFRFVNQVSPVGLYDLWHIDYVRLAAGEAFNATFNDVAFVDIPNSLLLEYEHMPWKHFLADISNQIVVLEFESIFYNHQEFTANPANESDILLRERTTGTNIPINLNVIDAQNVPEQTYSFFSQPLPANNVGNIISTINSQLSNLEKAELELEYTFTLPAQESINDQVSRIHRFDNFFAYDDGTAERQIYLENPQTDNPSFALEFESKIEDTLKAVQFHFPHINGNAENQLFSIHVYLDELSDDPAFSMEFLSPIYANTYFDSLQGFTTYVLKDIFGEAKGIPLASGQKFYIGFQQLSSTNFGVPIGLDINRDVSSKLFVNVWGGWNNQAGLIQGSPMIRAIVGSEDVIPTSTNKVDQVYDLKVYPNPTTGSLNINLSKIEPNTSCSIYDQVGKQVKRFNFANTIALDDLPQGMYFLNMENEAGFTYAKTKFVIIR